MGAEFSAFCRARQFRRRPGGCQTLRRGNWEEALGTGESGERGGMGGKFGEFVFSEFFLSGIVEPNEGGTEEFGGPWMVGDVLGVDEAEHQHDLFSLVTAAIGF